MIDKKRQAFSNKKIFDEKRQLFSNKKKTIKDDTHFLIRNENIFAIKNKTNLVKRKYKKYAMKFVTQKRERFWNK